MITPIKILIADDDLVMLKILTKLIKDEGHHTFLAVNGTEALAIAQEQKPELVLLDVNMPGLNGIEVCRKIKQDPSLTGTFVVVISGLSTDTESKVTGLESGADDYIVRPISNRELLARIRNMIRIQRTEGELRESRGKLQTLFGNLPGMAYRCVNHADWPMEFVSEGVTQLMGYDSRDLLIGGTVNYGDIIHPQDRARVFEEIQNAVKMDEPFQLEYRITTKSGEVRDVWERGKCVGIIDGNQYLEGFIMDITDKKSIETQLKRQLVELNRWYQATLGREIRIMELKDEVNTLSKEAGKPPVYSESDKPPDERLTDVLGLK